MYIRQLILCSVAICCSAKIVVQKDAETRQRPTSLSSVFDTYALAQYVPQYLLTGVVQTIGGQITLNQCPTPTGEQGTCMKHHDCEKADGISFGPCDHKHLVCCLKTPKTKVASCGAVITQDDVIFRNKEYPSNSQSAGTCQVMVKFDSDVCQLRLDFQEFVLASPETCGSKAGYCLEDAFSVSGGMGSRSFPVLCGHNTGQHMYVDVSHTTQAILSIRVGAKKDVDRRWSIRVSQISCWSPIKAPEGCLQYHTKVSDLITSFNYVRKPSGFHFLSNQHYTICIRRQLGFCSIMYKENGPNGLTLGTPSETCTSAYLSIPTGSFGTRVSGNHGDRFCAPMLPNSVIVSDLNPFRVSFVASGRIGSQDCPCPSSRDVPEDELVTEPVTTPQARAEFRQLDTDVVDCTGGGFHLRYTQIPCS